MADELFLIDGNSLAYRAFFALPESIATSTGFPTNTIFGFASMLVKLLTEQIIGYYDPKTKVLYVVKGSPEDYTGITIMHELIHALQDQYTNLDSLQHIIGDDDRAAAAQAVTSSAPARVAPK